MADPNGDEASKAFLEENKTKDRVQVTASGLQYKVLREGRGDVHPTVSTPCDCHYAGRLLDGTEFDSSYKRGSTTRFAPNQVIKGWTEAMQLMVEGDKWEMYIPWELAYGAAGKPPKIPKKAALIFIMEIVKIDGRTVPAKIEYPEWTEEQLKLWQPKDEEACQKWRETREKAWADGGKLKEQHPEREAFEAWLDKQCMTSRNKSLWKRTRRNYEVEEGLSTPSVAPARSSAPSAATRAKSGEGMFDFDQLEAHAPAGAGEPAEAPIPPPPFSELQEALGDVLARLPNVNAEQYEALPAGLRRCCADFVFLERDKKVAAGADWDKDKCVARMEKMLRMLEKRKAEQLAGCAIL